MDEITVRPWSEDDLPLLLQANTPEMTAHLNGPETDAQVADRHDRYLRLTASGEAWVFVIESEGRQLGSIGCWQTEWRGEPALETGWFVLPDAQGAGVASAALALVVEKAGRYWPGRRYLTAFPAVSNSASNGVCRRNGFSVVGVIAGEFRGASLLMNEWALDLYGAGTFPPPVGSAVAAEDV